MTDTVKLNDLIQQSGYKKSYIAKILGMAAATLARKINNAQDFKASEIDVLCDLLGINTPEDREAVFFARQVAD